MSYKIMFNLFLLVFWVYCYFYIGATTVLPEVGRLGDAAWPKALLLTGIVLLLVNLIKLARDTSKEKKDVIKFNNLRVKSIIRNKLFIGIVMMLIYSFALDYVGFITSSIMLFVFYNRLLGEKRWKKTIIYSFITVSLLYVIFALGLGIILPRGKWIFRAFALALESL